MYDPRSYFRTLRGRMYSFRGDDLLCIDRNTGTATILGTIDQTEYRSAADFGPDGCLYIASYECLLQIDVTSPISAFEVPFLEETGIYPTGLEFRADGTLYLLDSRPLATDARLYRLDIATGDLSEIREIAAVRLRAMDFDPQGRLWAIDYYSDELLELDPETAVVLNTYSVLYPTGRDTDDFAMTIDRAGRMFITNEYLLEITGYNTGTSSVTVIGPTGYSTLACLADNSVFFDDIDAITASKDDLYVEESTQPIIYERR